MHKRNLIFIFLCTFFAGSSVSASAGVATKDSSLLAALALDNAIRGLSDLVGRLSVGLEKLGHNKVAIGVIAIFALSLAQKESPEFFNTGVRLIESPFLLLQKKLQQTFCGGQSLTWNEVASWHNRVSRVLTPLTKTTSMVDLSKDRRLRIMDQDDGQEQHQDDQWLKQVAHIERECGFLVKMLTIRLAYYTDHVPSKRKKKKTGPVVRVVKAPLTLVQTFGKSVLRTSLTRNEEVAFGLQEAISYLQEIVEYCKSVSHFSGLDKEHMKRLMGNICTTFEHIGVLVDEISAADKNKKKLPMTADGSLTRGGYGGGSYGGYDSQYGSGA